jgi:hypothetical protein
MTKNDIQIGFDSEDEVHNYLNKNQYMDYKSINASELLLLLEENKDKYILLYKLKIEGNLEFKNLQFTQPFLFQDCQITGNVEMQNAIFKGIVSLKDLSYQHFIFNDTACEDIVFVTGKMSGQLLSFGNSGQPSTAKFRGVQISGCDLDSMLFFGSYDYKSMLEFNAIWIDLSNIKNCLFRYVKDSDIAIHTSKFNTLGVFGSTVKTLELTHSTFDKSATFSKDGPFAEEYFLGFTTITGPFNMHNCSFLSDIKFKNAVFNGVVNFTHPYTTDLIFSNTFSTNLNLNNSKFEKGLNLGTSKFLGGLNLGTSEFKGGLNLDTSQFKKVLDFNDCRIYKSLNWRQACYAGSLGDGIIHHNVNFAEATVDRPVALYPVCK